MKLFNKVLFLLAITLLANVYSNGQLLRFGNIDASKYPAITMEFTAKDASGKEIRNFNDGDITLTDSGCTILKPNIFVDCPPPGESSFSLILTLDYSGSMFTEPAADGNPKYQTVIAAAKAAILSLPNPKRWECAIVKFSSPYGTRLVHDFTNDVPTLLRYIDTAYKIHGTNTDYNAGFLEDCNPVKDPGALKIAEHAKFKPVVIFLTDGDHECGSPGSCPSHVNVLDGDIISAANNLKPTPASIFPIIVAASGVIPTSRVDLTAIAGATGGQYFESVPSLSDLQDLFFNILNTAGTLGSPAPCTITWDACCAGGQHLTMTVNSLGGVKNDTTYSISDAVKPSLEIKAADRNPVFINTPTGTLVKQKITITARKNFVVIHGPLDFISGNSKFKIDWNGITTFPDTIHKDTSIDIYVTYTGASDSAKYTTSIDLMTSACDGNLINPCAGWLYVNPVDVGATSIGVSINSDIKSVFCNTTCTPANITGLLIEGGQNTEFAVVSPSFPFVLPSDSCQSFTFSFKPADNGDRVSTIRVKTNLGEFTASIKGSASGYAEITTTPAPGKDILIIPNTDCVTTFRDTLIKISNPGALDLKITSITLTNNIDFSFPFGNPGSPIIKKNGDTSITVRFSTQSSGTPSTNLIIASNANNNPALTLTLKGTRDSIGYTVSDLNADFGELCPNEAKDIKVSLTNTGTVAVNITGADNAEFTLPVKSLIIPTTGGSQDFTIHFSSAATNTYNKTIILKDECGNTYIINCKALVGAPAISANPKPLILTETIGFFIDGKITIQNTSNRQLTITKATPRDGQITIVPPTQALNWVIDPGKSFDITVRYKPTDSQILNSYIDLEGTPCSFKDSLAIQGNPGLAIATLVIDNHSGNVGFPVTIPLHIRNIVNVDKSGATSINTRVLFDPTLLSYAGKISNGSVTPGNGYIDINNMLISGITGDILTNIDFNVLPGSPNTSTDMTPTNSVSNGGTVKFTETKGIFSIIPASATLEFGSVTANPGDVFDLPVKLLNINNITATNQNILATITYNGFLAEPMGATPKGNLPDPKTGIKTIDLTLPVIPDGTGLLQKLQFRAMLGTATETDFKVSGVKLAKGSGNITVTDGKLTLKGICNSGGVDRLFDPTVQGAAIVNVTPNPADDKVTITLQVQEPGQHSLVLFSTIGTKVLEILNSNLENGEIKVDADLKLISSGVYYLSYLTPSIRITKLISIMK